MTDIEYAVQDFGGDEIRDGFHTIKEARDYIKANGKDYPDWFVVRYSGFHSVKTERVLDFEKD